MKTKIIFWGVLHFLFNTAFGQNKLEKGLLPSLNINDNLKNNFSVNYRIESRYLSEESSFKNRSQKKYEYILTDFSVILAKKIGLHSRISGGYLLRFKEGEEIIKRYIQQLSSTNLFSNYNVAHRFVTDQTFSKNEAAQYRFRYRVSAEIPLNGFSLNNKEFYFRLNNEYLNSLQNNRYDLEIRLVPLLGYAMNEKDKIELGLDYRVNSFLKDTGQHTIWTCIILFIAL